MIGLTTRSSRSIAPLPSNRFGSYEHREGTSRFDTSQKMEMKDASVSAVDFSAVSYPKDRTRLRALSIS
jgi:hypothetical protein